MSPSPHLSFLHAKQRLKDQNYKSLWIPALIYGFCMQNRDFRTRITSLYGSQPSFMAFACKTATLGPELPVSMDPSPHLWFCAFTTATSWPELIVSMGFRPRQSFSACKTAALAPELQVSKGDCPHLWFLHTKQRLWIRITSLHWSQTSPIVLRM